MPTFWPPPLIGFTSLLSPSPSPSSRTGRVKTLSQPLVTDDPVGHRRIANTASKLLTKSICGEEEWWKKPDVLLRRHVYRSGVTERKLPACPQCPPCKSLHKPFSLPASRLFQALQHSHTFLDNLTSLEALLWGGHHVCSHLARPPMPEQCACA